VIANFYAYETAGNKGVSAGLNGVTITKRGEPLGRKMDWSQAMEGAEDFGAGPAAAGMEDFAAPAQGDEIPF